MAGKVTSAQLEEYQKAAKKYRKEFLAMLVIGIEEILPYVTVRPGIRHKEVVGKLSMDAQFAPYKVNMKISKDTDIAFRELETFMGGIDYEFESNSAATLVIGEGAATKGEGMKNADIVRKNLTEICKNLGENLNLALWAAVRNPSGTTTMDLFNGWDTITTTEISAGNISAAKGNYLKLTEAITSENAVDVLKNAFRKANVILKRHPSYMYMAPEIREAYEDAYATIHNATPWVQGFEQLILEGSNKKCKFVDLVSKAGSKYIHLSTKENMLVGVDQMGDIEDIEVARFSAFTLDFIATMFFGVEFESIDPRRLFVIELADEESGTETAAPAQAPANGGGSGSNAGTQEPASGGDPDPDPDPEGGDGQE